MTYGALAPYGYWVGTPTTATVDHCELGGSPDAGYKLSCTETWSVGGQPQTGRIKPPFRDQEQDGIKPGKSLDVRVHDGVAYTAASLGKGFYISIAAGAGVLLWGSVRLRRAWRGRNRG